MKNYTYTFNLLLLAAHESIAGQNEWLRHRWRHVTRWRHGRGSARMRPQIHSVARYRCAVFEIFINYLPPSALARNTPPTPTRRNCRVESRRRCERTRRQSWPIPVLLSYWGWWMVTSDDITTSLLKKLSILIESHVVKPLSSLAVWSVSRLSTESVGSRRELVANSLHIADAGRRDDSWDASAVCTGYSISISGFVRSFEITRRHGCWNFISGDLARSSVFVVVVSVRF